MDRRALRRRLRERFDRTMDKAIDAVQSAPDGQWVAGSEWAVRDAFQDLMRACFQEIVRARIERDPAAPAGSFSPGARAGGPGGAVQGRAAGRRAQRRR